MTDPSKHDDPFNIPSSSTQIETEPTTNQEIPLDPTRFQVRSGTMPVETLGVTNLLNQVKTTNSTKETFFFLKKYCIVHPKKP